MSSTITEGIPLAKRHGNAGRLTSRAIVDLRLHPSYRRHDLRVSVAKLSELAARGDAAFRDPLWVSRAGVIIAGFEQFELAHLRSVAEVPCLEFDLSENEALQLLIEKSKRSAGLNDYTRILLALEIEPFLKEKARTNQRTGGGAQGSSKLTEADRIDVREQIAVAAGVSTGNVTKVKRLVSDAIPEVQQALRDGEVSIHRAFTWLKNPQKQIIHLRLYRSHRGIMRVISTCQRSHLSPDRKKDSSLDLQRIAMKLAAMTPQERETIIVRAINVSSEVLYISTALVRSLESQSGLQL